MGLSPEKFIRANSWHDVYLFCKNMLDMNSPLVFMDWKSSLVKFDVCNPFRVFQRVILHDWKSATTLSVPNVDNLISSATNLNPSVVQEELALLRKFLAHGNLVKFIWQPFKVSDLLESTDINLTKKSNIEIESILGKHIRPHVNVSMFLHIASSFSKCCGIHGDSHVTQSSNTEDAKGLDPFETIFHHRIDHFIQILQQPQPDLWRLPPIEEKEFDGFYTYT
jgi:hypothetical protein